ncbi:protein-glutamate O-methyltransferase CheR [Paucisalibacillus sp. EB02]|uniref:CheR family methyltransferase n=1 Tax=Paucisalibacillus sp. EB02 TaxID=1347087 RepID=UPI0004B55CE8|nr:protein-glutamate O-methyltransferase CheR [Paucisalibacillus sp. EB02]
MSDDYQLFTEKVYTKLGIDLQKYKEAQMKRRLTSLREKRGYQDFTSYFNAINQDINLLHELVDRITINVSEFYRNPKRWEVLRDTVIPLIKMNNQELTIWSAACSTGEEPYSIAILLNEYFPELNTKILATDIDEKVLAKAKKGIYVEQALKELPTNLKAKYFKQKGSQFEIDSAIKRKVIFKKHNLLEDKYPTQVDLIICRNVLIYFTDYAKDTIYHNFSKALANNGILFVGSTEQIFSPNKYGLTLLDTFFYQKISQS